ncbi:branched chain amino acid aminotransferase [Candidatus Kuenenbacteria bacterium HGW-Kuenenbacteria-1]|uniref:Branched-chain-amino-acid aminotransferase n=1 Tax=Candidatus Kuenenbacteria bacterium HGW-Kuenenbacteria-1 TaxID=2013812 RepID=A0A2N1UN64_9BACT|nr:MAG: branched chain amino acid aminotransferase [Candidatus Kuenenbacteria bacterium HGW-Kuenenbacteria-1]
MPYETKYIWLDGKFVPFAQAKIHIINHSLHYGSAVFEGIRCYKTAKGSAVFRLTEHIDRLFHSGAVMGMKIPYKKVEIIKIIKELIRKNKLSECYIRPIIFYGNCMKVDPHGASVHFSIIIWPWGKLLNKDSVTVKTSPFIRIHPQSSIMSAKISGHYVNSSISSMQATKAGYDEALLLDYRGNIAEGPGENIFFVKKKIINTPKKGTILPGITRDSIEKIVIDLGYKFVQKEIKPKDIKNYEEAFFTGTAAEVNAIGKIDNYKFGQGKEGKAVKEIKEKYIRIIHGEEKKYEKWLSYINA